MSGSPSSLPPLPRHLTNPGRCPVRHNSSTEKQKVARVVSEVPILQVKRDVERLIIFNSSSPLN